MARHSGKPIRTFSIAFDNPDDDESSIARLVARQFGTDHMELRAEDLGPDELLTLLGHLDEPFADAAIVPTYALSKMTAGHVKVALSGDGGDEVFGGYPKYLLGRLNGRGVPLQPLLHQSLRALPWKPRGVSHVYWRTLSSQDRIRWSWVGYGDFPIFRKDLRQVLMPAYYEAARVDRYFEPWERRARRYGQHFDSDLLMRTDLETYLSENCLVKTDRASMLASLEIRVPYLDNIVLDRILPLHADIKIVNGTLKALLLPIVQRILPKEVWNRPKHGLGMPLENWLKGQWRPAVETALDWGEANMDLFDFRYLRRLHKINICEGGIGMELWKPLVFLAWAMVHKAKL
jgi:asparagine synthase (glutamine-hydrolysing)